MIDRFDLVISADNNHYLAWQSQLCCFSAFSRLRLRPIVVLHSSGSPLRPEFLDLERRGVCVVQAPSFAKIDAVPIGLTRNLAGTLLAAATSTVLREEHLLLCEPDMLFVRPIAFRGSCEAHSYSYVKYDSPRVTAVLQQWGLETRAEEFNLTSRVGVPYLLSREVCHRLGSRWLAVIDSFPQLEWTDVMPAFAIAAALEQVPIIASDLVDTNGNHARQVTRGIVHYCYGDDTWNKRSYHSFESPLSDSRPSPQAEPGSVLAEILTQIAEARRWFAAEQREVMIASAASAP